MSVRTRSSSFGAAGNAAGAILAWLTAMYALITQEVLQTLNEIQLYGTAKAFDRLLERWVPDTEASGVRARAYQVQQVITGLIIVITVSISVVIVARFNQSTGDVQNSALSSANESVLQGFADMVGLIAPLLLVIIAVVIVAYVQKMRG